MSHDSEQREFTSWWLRILALIIPTVLILGLIGFGMNSCGLFAGTVVERKVYENSYQNSEARRTEIMTMESQLVELDAMLADPTLPDAQRRQIQGQKRAVNVRLETARKKYDQVLLKE